MVEAKGTLMDRLQLDKMHMCSCQRERVIYFCDDSQCESRQAQPYYCDECAESSEMKHLHAPKKIVRETQMYNMEWSKLRDAIRNIVTSASTKFNELGPLIRYLEKALVKMPRIKEDVEIKALWEDYTKLRTLQEKVEVFYRDDVEPFFINFKVEELIQVKPQCIKYMDTLKNYLHLENITENTLWQFYSIALDTAGDEPFIDFSQDNKDTFQRLKFRSLEERLAKMSQG